MSDVVESVTIRFPYNWNNKIGERRKKTVKAEDIQFREIKYISLGKCFEINLEQFQEPLGYVRFKLKMSSYIYVNSMGQFLDRDSKSKVQVKLGNCLWIELTYEMINRTLEGTCRRWQPILYVIIFRPTYSVSTKLHCLFHLIIWYLFNCNLGSFLQVRCQRELWQMQWERGRRTFGK